MPEFFPQRFPGVKLESLDTEKNYTMESHVEESAVEKASPQHDNFLKMEQNISPSKEKVSDGSRNILEMAEMEIVSKKKRKKRRRIDDEENPLKIVPDGEIFFNVEKILKKRVVDGHAEYLIRWEGYHTDDDTWEPGNN